MQLHQNNHLTTCWRHQDCYNCIHENRVGCGWCPTSSTCIPASSLLQPVSKANICPLKDERFELRTKALGCGCSTTTLLSIIVTVFATIAALFLLWGVGVLIARFNRTFGTGTWRGVEMECKDDGTRTEQQWRRKGRLTLFFRRHGTSSNQSEQERFTERTRLLG